MPFLRALASTCLARTSLQANKPIGFGKLGKPMIELLNRSILRQLSLECVEMSDLRSRSRLESGNALQEP